MKASNRNSLTGGELNAAVARSAVRARNRYAGRGPTKAQAFYRDDVIVVIMKEVMTTMERSLSTDGRTDAVLGVRRELQRTMRPALVATIEDLTGCHVISFMTADDLDSDVAAMLYILDRPLGDGALSVERRGVRPTEGPRDLPQR